MPIDTNVTALNLDDYKYGFKDPDNYVFKSEKGLSRKVVEQISGMKEEPEWMLKFRLKALEIYEKKPVPTWGADLSSPDKGVIFDSIEDGLKNHPDLFREYFATVIPPHDNKYAALNSAVWSGGSFIYVPPGVNVDIPLQAYFRVNSEKLGQFERTLIIADEGARLHY